MDLEHYRIQSTQAVSEGKCPIVGFVRTLCIQGVTGDPYCTGRMYLKKESDLLIQF